MLRKLPNNPLQKDVAKSEDSRADKYLRPFFEKITDQEYTGLSSPAYKELVQIPEQFRQDVYRMSQKKTNMKSRTIITCSDIAESAREYISQQIRKN